MKRTLRRPLVGREPELATVRALVDSARQGALLLSGEPGVGKTTLWEAGIEAARERGIRVLHARAAEAETKLSFAALSDLLQPVGAKTLGRLPAPQRHAVEVALLRADPAGDALEPRTIALGLLTALRELATRTPVLVAVDDLQWLDRASAQALAFVGHRFPESNASFLLTKRSGSSSTIERAFRPEQLEQLELTGLSLGATRRLLRERLGLILPRRVLRDVFELTRGNPLFALELGRSIAARGVPEIGHALTVPETLEELLLARMRSQSKRVRRTLLAVALGANLLLSELAAVVEPDAIDDAVDEGLLLVENDRVRLSHPLLAAAATMRSRARERRELCLDLAGAVGGELRIRLFALAADRPDAKLAATVSAAAANARARGAVQEAVELAEHALRLTPPESGARSERLLELAGYLETAGELQRVTELLTPELPSLPPGAPRARAWLLLAEGGHIRTVVDYKQHLARALAESEHDPALRARVVAKMSSAVIGVERIHEAEAEALEVLPLARRAEPDVERLVLLALTWARALSGRAIDDLCERFEAASPVPAHMTESPDRVAGQRLIWRGELDKARVTFTRLLAIADERGEAGSYAVQRLHLCELALRAGEWEEASRLLDEWAESADRDFLVPPMYERCRALLAAGRGEPADAERWATEAIAGAEAMGVQFDWLEALRAKGIAALLAHEPAQAAECIATVWQHTRREGVDEPGVFPVAPELVEDLVELGELDEARSVTSRLRRLSTRQEHPWGLATTRRCEALVDLASASRRYERTAECLRRAAEEYSRLGLRFDRARSLLVLGRWERRLKKWGAARRSLEQAVSAFDEIGSDGWVEQARDELARVGARRRRADGGLTPTEQRVAALAAEGLSNKEIAATLFVTVHTVEVHLSHAYAKLGVRSRSQLAQRLGSTAQPPKV